MKSDKILVIKILAIILFLAVGAFLISKYFLDNYPPRIDISDRLPETLNTVGSRIDSAAQNIEKEESENENLIRVSYPLTGAKIGGTIYVTGIARGTWYFEGDFPTELVDASGKILTSVPTSAIGWWMTEEFVPFSAVIKYPVQKSTPAKIILRKDNPSDMRELDASIEIPVVLEPETSSAAVYFGSRYFDKNESICGQVFPSARPVSSTMASARETLEALLKGPTDKEKELGYNTAIPPDVKIQQFDATLPVAKVDLSRELLQMDVDVACRRILIEKQITETIKKSSGAKSVELTVDGRDFPGEFSSEGPEQK